MMSWIKINHPGQPLLATMMLSKPIFPEKSGCLDWDWYCRHAVGQGLFAYEFEKGIAAALDCISCFRIGTHSFVVAYNLYFTDPF